MNSDLLLRGFLFGLLSLSLGWGVFSKYNTKGDSDLVREGGQRYSNLIHGAVLPCFLFLVFFVGMIAQGFSILKLALSTCFEIFVHISLYYAVLMILHPFFRKHISARSCALLWLLPNYLYYTQMAFAKVSHPLFTIRMSNQLMTIITSIWFIGFLAVFIWGIVSHLLFRRRILKHAVPVTDSAVLDLFYKEISEIGLKKPKLKLVMTDDVSSPLTIGLFKRCTKIILTEKNYSLDELRLIFRHELIHISREDSWAKFFMIFCTAFCWFNPLMWVAMKKSAEDIELSCDETVLLNANEEIRNQYANLILRTAGDDRGFSTCLNTSVSSLRYRLKSIAKPGKRCTGALTIGLTFFILSMTSGYVSLAYGDQTGENSIFGDRPLNEFIVDSITVNGGEYKNGIDHIDADALTHYIASLPTQEWIENISYRDDEKKLSIRCNGMMFIDLYTDYISTIDLGEKHSVRHTYYLPNHTDWEYVDSIVPPIPTAKIDLSDGTPYIKDNLDATVIKLVYNHVILKERKLQPDEGAGIYGSRTYQNADVTFSMPLISKVEVLVETWDYSSSYTTIIEKTSDPISFEVANYPAHYTISASFQGQRGIYDATFSFHIGKADSL